MKKMPPPIIISVIVSKNESLYKTVSILQNRFGVKHSNTTFWSEKLNYRLLFHSRKLLSIKKRINTLIRLIKKQLQYSKIHLTLRQFFHQ